MALATFLKLSIVSKHSMALHHYIMKAKNAKIADAALDCIIRNAHRIELKGESMCKKEKLTTLTNSEKAETIAPWMKQMRKD